MKCVVVNLPESIWAIKMEKMAFIWILYCTLLYYACINKFLHGDNTILIMETHNSQLTCSIVQFTHATMQAIIVFVSFFLSFFHMFAFWVFLFLFLSLVFDFFLLLFYVCLTCYWWFPFLSLSFLFFVVLVVDFFSWKHFSVFVFVCIIELQQFTFPLTF